MLDTLAASPRSCMCGSLTTSSSSRTGAQGTRMARDLLGQFRLGSVAGPLGNHGVELVHVRDARFEAGESSIVRQVGAIPSPRPVR